MSSLKNLGLKTSSLDLEKYSLSAFLNKEDEELCELYTEEFDLEMEGEIKVEKFLDMPLKPEMLVDDGSALDSNNEVDSARQHLELPMKMLGFFILCVCVLHSPLTPLCECTLSANQPEIHDCSFYDLFFLIPSSAHKNQKLHKNQ